MKCESENKSGSKIQNWKCNYIYVWRFKVHPFTVASLYFTQDTHRCMHAEVRKVTPTQRMYYIFFNFILFSGKEKCPYTVNYGNITEDWWITGWYIYKSQDSLWLSRYVADSSLAHNWQQLILLSIVVHDWLTLNSSLNHY